GAGTRLAKERDGSQRRRSMRTAFAFACILFSVYLNGQVTSEDLLKSPGTDWLTYHGDYAGKRFSPLHEIDTESVNGLVPKWVRHFDTGSDLEATPLVYEGVMYTTA